MKENKNQQYILHSVDKALSIIDLFCEHESLSAQEVAQLSGIGKSTAFRLLTTLENRAFLRKGPNARYCLGAKFYSIRMLMNDRKDLAAIMRPYLTELSEGTGETCHLSVLSNDSEILFVDHIPSKSRVRVSSALGQSSPLYITSAGKAILAFQRRAFIRSYAENLVFEQRTPNTIKNVASLYKQLDEIRHNGYACDSEEYEIGLTCYGAAILNAHDESIAALCISGPTARMVQNQEHYAEVLKKVAADGSQALRAISG